MRFSKVFAEPASAISFAGLIKAFNEGLMPHGSTAVCVLTGNGLKDSDIILKSDYSYKNLSSDYKAIEEYILEEGLI